MKYSLIIFLFSHTLQIIYSQECSLDPSLIQEISGYQSKVDDIMNFATNGPFKGRAFSETAKFVDQFAHRLPGSQVLEDSIDYMMEKMRAEGRTNVIGEEVPLKTSWKRGPARAELRSPRVKPLNILSLGPSVSTPPGGIQADAIVVHSFDDLEEFSQQIPGKIVVFNYEYTYYGESGLYRNYAASAAASHGGVAALVRSSTPFSLDTPHTGGMVYWDNTAQIPAATLTIEDAEFLDRLSARGEEIQIFLEIINSPADLDTSRNAWGDLEGSELPDEFVIVSGHIDCWDVGQGALDDGSGVLMATEALELLEVMGLRPRRSMRAILWTAEEFGLEGAQTHMENHGSEYSEISGAFEIDGGTFTPQGLDFAGSDEAACIVQEILKLFTKYNMTQFERHPSVSTDIFFMQELGVPGFSLKNKGEFDYFYFHHSEADTMTSQDSEELDQVLGFWTAVSFIVADLSIFLPRVSNL